MTSDTEELSLLRREFLVGQDALGVELRKLRELRLEIGLRCCGGGRCVLRLRLGLRLGVLRGVLLLLVTLHATPRPRWPYRRSPQCGEWVVLVEA